MIRTCPPEHGVVEEGELHLRVMLQRGPASRRRHVDVGHVERNLHRQEGLSRVPDLEEQPRRQPPAGSRRPGLTTTERYLKVSGDGPAADIDELCHVVIGVKGPNAALQVEVLVELDGLGFPDVWVELVGAVVTRTQRDAVVGHVVQEARLCGTTLSISPAKRERRRRRRRPSD